jgi:hypothetical protein
MLLGGCWAIFVFTVSVSIVLMMWVVGIDVVGVVGIVVVV